MTPAQASLCAAVAGGPRHIREIATMVGISVNAAAKAVCYMVKRGTVLRCGSGLYRMAVAGEEPAPVLRKYTVAQTRRALEALAAGATPKEVATAHGISWRWAENLQYLPIKSLLCYEWYGPLVAKIRTLTASYKSDRRSRAARASVTEEAVR